MVGSFPITICVRLKYDKICVIVPVNKATTCFEMKKSFLEAISAMDDIGGSTLVTDNIKLWKQSSDDGSNEIWIGLDNTATVDKSGLDQGHIVGVSIQKDGDFAEPVIAIPPEAEPIMDD
ncbi:MAG: hypothetical protein CYPHOPRED_003302 [Cyphobasidiales sp. Tagirdzhanova-0007]|nr:MAG: hypothetical protein CYPHOPRED_003302 [Cyphobasidiales sp. Tagirdzhanova-0007]